MDIARHAIQRDSRLIQSIRGIGGKMDIVEIKHAREEAELRIRAILMTLERDTMMTVSSLTIMHDVRTPDYAVIVVNVGLALRQQGEGRSGSLAIGAPLTALVPQRA